MTAPSPSTLRRSTIPGPTRLSFSVSADPAKPSAAGAPPIAHLPFEQAATLVLSDLQHALADLFAAVPGDIRKAADVERAFGINHLLGWQLYRIATAQNPLAAGMHVPARVSMKKLLTAAARRRAPADILDRVSSALDAFEQLMESDAGNRDELDAMLTAFVPEERHKQDLASREAAFKAMSHIRGLATEFDVAAMFFHPSGDGRSVDRVALSAQFGLRRVRPDAHIVLSSGDSYHPTSPMRTLDGRAIDGPMGTMLPQFSTNPLPRLETHELADTVFHRVAGNDVGLRSALDLVMADRRDQAFPRYADGRPRRAGPSYSVDTPVKRGTLDAFVHRDLFPDSPARLWVYNTATRGQVPKCDDPTREYDRLHTSDVLRTLPAGLTGARLAHIPRYTDILEHLYRTLGWDPAEFRGHRLDVQYPIYGAQYLIGFNLPDPPPAP